MILGPLIFSVITFISTFLGGLFALKFQHRLHYIMAFAAGVLMGIVSFDILPEIAEQSRINNFALVHAMIALVVGFLVFHILEKSILVHHYHEESFGEHRHPNIGIASALALAGHSFMDGVAIGLGFQISSAIGFLIAIAVISHDFTDGMNTVTLMLSHKNTDKKARLLLFLTAVTPILGVLSTIFFSFPPYFLFLYLGFFAGFLLYIGASDILPEAHSRYSSYGLLGLTALGTIFIFIITKII